jgi:restriction endonuclease S subunit
MPSSRHWSKIGDHVTLVRGKTYKSQLLGLPGPVLLGLGTITPGGGFRPEKLKTYGGDAPSSLLVSPGELYASLKGATKDGDMVGSVARLPLEVGQGRLTQDTVRLDFRLEAQNPRFARFLYWVLRTPQCRAYCGGRATGSAQVGLSREDFLAYPVPPFTDERDDLAALLDALDNKIELNRKMNRTLEEMAQALFKSWFIDFDGHDDLVASEIGPVPRGWEVKPIGDAVKVVGGSTPSTNESAYWEGGTHAWATPKDLSGLAVPVLLGTERQVTDAGLQKISSGVLPAGTFLLSSRAPIGYTAISQVPTAINQGFIAIPPGGELTAAYLLFWTRFNMDTIKGRAGGTTFAEISKAAFRPIPVVVPPQGRLGEFERVVGPLIDRIVANARESLTLTDLRDTLLPKLISGELRVPEAEEQVETAS